ncbi:MAG TPA: hypothetical protein VF702_12855 [Allosphingosinicella sp.]|jgi:hypothetical protein
MDLAFLSRAERMLARDQAAHGIDYGVLVATLAAHQAASATARAAAASHRGSWDRPNDALAELLAAGPAWRAAARAQSGSFNPRAASAAVNAA